MHLKLPERLVLTKAWNKKLCCKLLVLSVNLGLLICFFLLRLQKGKVLFHLQPTLLFLIEVTSVMLCQLLLVQSNKLQKTQKVGNLKILRSFSNLILDRSFSLFPTKLDIRITSKTYKLLIFLLPPNLCPRKGGD